LPDAWCIFKTLKAFLRKDEDPASITSTRNVELRPSFNNRKGRYAINKDKSCITTNSGHMAKLERKLRVTRARNQMLCLQRL
jgi:hypothetical protein